MGLKLSALSTLYMGLSFWNPRATDIWIWWWSIDVKTLDSRPRPRPNFLVYETLFSSLFTCELFFCYKHVSICWYYILSLCSINLFWIFIGMLVQRLDVYKTNTVCISLTNKSCSIYILHLRKPIFHSNLKENKTENLYFNT